MTRNESKALRNTVIQGKMAEICGGIVKKAQQADKFLNGGDNNGTKGN